MTFEEKPKRPNHNDVAMHFMHYPSRKIVTFQDTDEIYMYDQQTGEGTYAPAEAQLEYEIQEFVGEGTTMHYVKEVLAAIKRQTRTSREIASNTPYLIPLKNGILDAKKMELMPYNKNYFFLHKHPIEYSLTATYPKIEEFLNQITKTPEDKTLLKEIAGYCFIRHYNFQNIFLLIGEGANGKSVYLNLLVNMLGEHNITKKTLQALTNYHFAQAALFGKNANIFADLPQKAFTDTGIMKALSGGDWIDAEQKFKQAITFKNHAKLIASCNEAPQSPDNSDAFFRRWVTISFPNKFEGQKENRKLLEELSTPEELSGFFYEAIMAYMLAEERGSLSYTATTSQKKKTYLLYSNNVQLFAEEHLEQNSMGEIKKAELYKRYADYCLGHAVPKRNIVWFFRELYKQYGGAVYQSRKYGEDPDLIVMGISWKEKEALEPTE